MLSSDNELTSIAYDFLLMFRRPGLSAVLMSKFMQGLTLPGERLELDISNE